MKFDSVWKLSHRLLFGRMYEDAEIERRAFPSGCRLFCIASAGCTAMALAHDHEVTAVDLNPAQVAYARSRALGAPRRIGALDGLAQAQRRALVVAGWTRARLDRFLDFDDCGEQLAFWHAELNNLRFRTLVDAKLACDSLVFRLVMRDTRLALPNLGSLLRHRLERGFARHPNRRNPYAQALLGGKLAETVSAAPSTSSIRFETADAIAFLNSMPAGSFDAFSLSNIADGATGAFRERLLEAVRHAASPDAIAVLRTFGEPDTAEAAEFAAQDRGLVWGSIQVGRARELR